MYIWSISRKTEQNHSFWPEVKQNYNFSPTTLNGPPQRYSMLAMAVDWQQLSRRSAEAGALRLSVSLPLLPAWWGRVVQPGGGKSSGTQLWQSAQPMLVKFTFCLQKVKLTKTFQVRSLETCQFDFSQWKNGIFVHKINKKKKKSILQEGHVLLENPSDWTFPTSFTDNLYLLWKQHKRSAKYTLTVGIIRIYGWQFKALFKCW